MKIFPFQVFGLLIVGMMTVNLSANAQNYFTNVTSANGQLVTNVTSDSEQSSSPQALVANATAQSSIAPTFKTNVESVAGSTVITVVVDNTQTSSAKVINTNSTGINVLAVNVAAPKLLKDKAVVEITMKNNLTETIKSARAIAFLLDEQGQVIGQSSKWVIGGTKDLLPLQSNSETTFNFIISSSQPFSSTNVTAKVSFSRVVLDNGKSANLANQVIVTQAAR
jgi:hypothetical protein